MGNWVEKYKQLALSSSRRHLIASDPDQLFSYPELREALEAAGFSILRANSALDVRILFELKVRDSDQPCLLLAPDDYQILPDIHKFAQYVSPGLRDLFPYLDPAALKGLSYSGLCLLFNLKPYEALGFERTVRFILENLYQVDTHAIESARSRERLLDILITVLIEREGASPPVIQFLQSLIGRHIPELAQSELSGRRILEYLQGVWSAYASGEAVDIHLEDPALRKSIGYLFVRGELKPVCVSKTFFETVPRQLRIGLYYDGEALKRREIAVLLDYLKEEYARMDDLPESWFKLMPVLAKAMKISFDLQAPEEERELQDIVQRLNNRFQQFIEHTYGSLFSRSGVRHPVLVSRVLEYIKAQPVRRKALVVLDGLNFWQWTLLEEALSQAGFAYKTGATLAYIPTITAWSRQALLRGEKPDLESNNSKEAFWFRQYWKSAGMQEYQVQYARFGAHQPFRMEDLSPDVQALALVCNDLDDLMHGAVLGNAQLRANTLQWIEKSGIVSLIALLKSSGFAIYLTTDHGNLEARGIKNLKVADKVGSVSRGKRHLQYSNEVLLRQFQEQNPSLRYGIRDLSVYLKDAGAFTDADACVVTHGGSHLWEVLIPFIEL